MPTSYCATGHRVSYSDIKPTVCPTCNGPMTIAAVTTPPPTTRSAPHAMISRPQSFEKLLESAGRQEVESGGFDIEIQREPGEPAPRRRGVAGTTAPEFKFQTVEAFRQGPGVERTEPQQPAVTALRNGRHQTANDLVKEMLAQGSENPAPVTKAPKRAPRRKGAAK